LFLLRRVAATAAVLMSRVGERCLLSTLPPARHFIFSAKFTRFLHPLARLISQIPGAEKSLVCGR
jgi:hypothetical protein